MDAQTLQPQSEAPIQTDKILYKSAGSTGGNGPSRPDNIGVSTGAGVEMLSSAAVPDSPVQRKDAPSSISGMNAEEDEPPGDIFDSSHHNRKDGATSKDHVGDDEIKAASHNIMNGDSEDQPSVGPDILDEENKPSHRLSEDASDTPPAPSQQTSSSPDTDRNEEKIQEGAVSTPISDAISTAVSPFNPTPLLKEQLKYCGYILKTLKRHKDSFPFLQPVDPVALQIPDYPEVVKSPMDLGTAAKKLSSSLYTSLDGFTDDVKLVFSNCYIYNRPDNPVYIMGKNLEKSFDSMMKKMPTGASAPPPPDAQSPFPSPDSFNERGRRHSALSRSSESLDRSSSPNSRKTSSSANHTRRKSASSASNEEDLKFAFTLIKDFFGKKYSSIAWPFLQPVDPTALGIPDYLEVVKTPMDLGTIKKKSESRSYSTPSEFEADFRLMAHNCYIYNSPESDVVKLCRSVERAFNDRWAERPSVTQSLVSPSSKADEDEEDALIAAKSHQIQVLQAEIKTLLVRKSARKAAGLSKSASSSHSSTPLSSKRSRPSGTPKKASSSSLKPLTFEEKRQLSLDINDLPPERLGRVLEIIHESMPHIKDDAENGEIELDVDTLNLKTLHALCRYVRQCKGVSKSATSSKKQKSSYTTSSSDEDNDGSSSGTDSD